VDQSSRGGYSVVVLLISLFSANVVLLISVRSYLFLLLLAGIDLFLTRGRTNEGVQLVRTASFPFGRLRPNSKTPRRASIMVPYLEFENFQTASNLSTAALPLLQKQDCRVPTLSSKVEGGQFCL
jgi:hypothetical protein